MKGTPHSIWLSMAHQVGGYWTSAAVTAMKRQQHAMISEAMKLATGKKPKRTSRRSSRKSKS
jgi:hypothetical protein